ncbi:uncharacterized protein BDW43DRAFT_308874 [Aspergillus alliaceus]|uniref:uncharacterized protein n=1 Tax=Petromyces alliaceus TaxID=209559 RepID=UPI0012A63686|nr:uncharacterized protein BDW43DRAFT_308874 [Aspergillus alliaceus]KAB8236075.1 hypothetical protein BDW43DRAFT_308874 [Aspergillus alliaceus]
MADWGYQFWSAWAADPLNNWLGRRGTNFVTGLLYVASFPAKRPNSANHGGKPCIPRSGAGFYPEQLGTHAMPFVYGLYVSVTVPVLSISRLFTKGNYPAMGAKISTTPVFSAEVSPASIRGGLVTDF